MRVNALIRVPSVTGEKDETPDVPGRIPPFRELTGKRLLVKKRPEPTDVTVLTKRGQSMRYWTDGSPRRDA